MLTIKLITDIFILSLFVTRVQGYIGHGVARSHFLSNASLTGIQPPPSTCKHHTTLYLHQNAQVKMCTGIHDQDLKNGMTIIKLVESRGFLPTCRVMQLMLWMASEVSVDATGASMHGHVYRDAFVDIGANIGSCSVHMAALGFPVVAVEPVLEHVNTILGSISLNPSFHLDILHMGISAVDKSARINFGHGARNWGATYMYEVQGNDTSATELQLTTTDHVIGHRRVALMKVDCEGCELDAIKGAKRTLKRIPMIKMELVQPEYISGNETMKADAILGYLHNHGYDIFIDHWNEQHLYFGKQGSTILEIDKMFGSSKFGLVTDYDLLVASARKILSEQIDHQTFNHGQFLKRATDIIAIERSLSARMKQHFLTSNPTPSS